MAKLCLAFRGRPIQAHHFEANTEVTVGSDAGCTIAIDSLAVAPLHAKIISTAYNCRIIALDKELPTLVNHDPVTDCYLSHGDIIQVGKHTLAFSEDNQAVGVMYNPSSASQQSMSDEKQSPHKAEHTANSTKEEIAALEETPHFESCVQIVSGKHFGQVVPLDNGVVRLGYAGQASAAIAHRRDGYFLSHLEGKRPPKVNGESIGEQSYQLHNRDKIRIGNVRMIFYLRSAAASTAASAIKA